DDAERVPPYRQRPEVPDAPGRAGEVRDRRARQGQLPADGAGVPRTPPARLAARSRTAATPAARSGAFSRRCTNAEPTIPPSANFATSAAWAPSRTPRPTATGRGVCARTVLTSPAASPLTASRAPVMPIS